MEITELLTKLRDATEGSRDLDRAIALALGWTSFTPEYGVLSWLDAAGGYAGIASIDTPPEFTAALDAALALVSEVGGWRMMASPGTPKPFSFAVGLPSRNNEMRWHDAPTAALAVCIAALEARRK